MNGDTRKSVTRSSPDVNGERLNALFMRYARFYEFVRAVKVDGLTGFEGLFEGFQHEVFCCEFARSLQSSRRCES